MPDNSQRLSQYTFNLFKGGIKVKKPTQTITLADAIALIGGTPYEIATRELRALEPDLQKVFKADLDYVTFSGTFTPTRLVKNLKQHSDLFCLDFDHVANLWETRLQLQADPQTLVLFTSPSGKGLKVIFEVPGLDAEPERHKGFFQDMAIYMRQTYGLEVDASGSDVSRACFLVHDPSVYVNLDAESYHYRGLALAEHQQAKKPKTEHQLVKDATDVYRHVLAVVERIEAAQIDISGGSGEYDVRLLAFCMSTLGDDGRPLLHRILQFYPNYTIEETDAKFDQGRDTSRFTTPWKFFDIAKQYGIDVSKPSSKKKVKTSVERAAGAPVPHGSVVEHPATAAMAETPAKPKKAERDWTSNVDYKEGGIWIWGTKNWICVAENFQLFVKYCTEDENEEKTWILEVNIVGRKEPLYIEITHDEFCSATKLKNKLAGHRLALKITDTYLGELWQHLFKMTFPQAVKVMRLGHHPESGVFFFANKAVNGQILEPDEFGIVTVNRPNADPLCLSMPVVKKKRNHLFTLSVPTGQAGTLSFNDWFGMLVRVHKYDNAVIPACFYLMSLFRDVVVKHTNASPILYLKGGASSGKSSIARSLCRLYNLHEAVANLKNKNTEAGLVRVMSQTANSVIWMDEYHNDFPFEGLLQSAYDDNGYIRAEENSSNGTETIDIFSALALTSNYIPDNSIFFSRCVFVPIVEQQKTEAQVEAFAQFRDMEQGGLSHITLEMLSHRALIVDGLKQANDDLYTHLKEAVKHEKVVERLISNMARVLAPAYILQVFGKVNLHFDVTNDDDVLQEFVDIGSRMILRQHQIQSEKTALSEFFELMQNQYESGGIQEGIHFRFEGDLVYLRFPSLYTIYAQRYRQTFWKAPSDRDTLKQEMIAFEASNDPDRFFKNVRFLPGDGDDVTGHSRSVSGSCTMTYSKLANAFGVDWKGQRLEKVDR
jgi:hypothetical protein